METEALEALAGRIEGAFALAIIPLLERVQNDPDESGRIISMIRAYQDGLRTMNAHERTIETLERAVQQLLSAWKRVVAESGGGPLPPKKRG